MPNRSRRQLLALLGTAAVTGLAGCGENPSDGTPRPTDQPTDTETPDGGTGTPTVSLTATLTPTRTPSPTRSTPGTTTPTPPPSATPTPTPTGTPTKTPTPTATPTPTPDAIRETRKITASDGDAEDGFGTSVAVDGDTAVVGAPGDTNRGGSGAGAAYVFVGDGDGWVQQAQLTASDGDAEDEFGGSVAVAGDVVAVGAPGDGNLNGSRAGAVYVFEFDGNTWRQQAKLTPNLGDTQDEVGSVVAVVGRTVLAGTPLDTNPNGDEAGAVYVFANDGSGWTERSRLTASDGDTDANFGASLSVDGDTAVVGAPGDTDGSGSVYVFIDDGGWTERTKLTASDADVDDRFGGSVEVAGDTVVVGAPADGNRNGSRAGAVYTFQSGGGAWSQQAKFTASDGDTRDEFGTTVTLVDGTALVGVPNDTNPTGTEAGAVYVFDEGTDAWTERVKLTADDGDAADRFGGAIAATSDTAVVGAPVDENPNGPGSGSAYVFDL